MFKHIGLFFWAIGLVGRAIAAPPPPPPPSNVTDLAGVGPLPNVSSQPGYSNVTIQQEVQLSEFVRNIQVAVYQYGIDNIPKFGFAGYPRELIDYLQIWKAQCQFNIFAAETVLDYVDKPTVPPCEYSIAVDILGTAINSTDAYLTVAEEITLVALGQNLYLDQVAASVDPSLATSAGAAATVEARRDAYFKAIAGANPTPQLYGTVIPPAFVYWQTLYYTQPGSCPSPFPLPPFHPLKRVNVSPPSQSPYLSPAAAVPRGATITFSYDAASLSAAPEYGAFLNQVNEPVYEPLTVFDNGTASVVVPQVVVGNAFLSFTTNNTADTIDGVAAASVAGPFNLIVN